MDPNGPTLDNIEEGRHEDAGDFSCTSYHDQDLSTSPPVETKLADKEAKTVTWLRIGLVAVLLIATVVSALGIYFFTNGLEQDEFEQAFADNSAKILEAFSTVADRRFGALAAFTTSFTAHNLAINATWPFVSIPQFAAQGEHVMSLADALSLTFLVIVEPEDRPKWENEFIPVAVKEWFAEDALYTNQSLQGTRHFGGPLEPEEDYEGKPTLSDYGVYEQIRTRRITPSGARGSMIAENETSLVWWQMTPFVPGVARTWINLNVRYDRVYGGTLLEQLRRKRVVLGTTSTDSYGSQGMPISSVNYPIMTGFGEDARVGGSIVTLMNWDSFFADVLPKNSKGLVAVLKNTCEQAYTFKIDGPEVLYLGEGDLHDSSYDDMMREVSFTALLNQGVEEGTYEGLRMDEEGCQYSLEVYASSEMEDEFISHMPIVYTVGAVVIFAFTSLIFIVYDKLVTRRQRLVEKEAQKSGAIVSSLFPEAYKEKLMKEQEQRLENKTGTNLELTEADSKKLSNMMAGRDDDLIPIEDQIADLYPDCTVFFADIAVSFVNCHLLLCFCSDEIVANNFLLLSQGFTRWSSNRTPSQVFTLLQTLFGRFDRLAKRRSVFKVETM